MTSSINDPSALTNQLPVSIELPKEPGQFIETMTILYKRIAQTVNTKEGGLFSAQEFMSNQQYNLNTTSSFKTVYRKVFDMVALNGAPIASGATASFPHGITSIVSTTDIYGSATNSDPKFIPLPYVSATVVTQQVQIYATSTNIVLINGATNSALTSATIVLEYLKN